MIHPLAETVHGNAMKTSSMGMQEIGLIHYMSEIHMIRAEATLFERGAPFSVTFDQLHSKAINLPLLCRQIL